MDRFNVEKAIITTINRTRVHENQREVTSKMRETDQITKFMNDFKKRIPKDQLPHEDVINLANKAPERFYKFFWFNPNIEPEEEENSYKILEDHFKKGFCGVKIHPGFNFIKIPRDIIKLTSFLQDFDKDLLFFIHSLPKTAFFGGISPKDIAKLASQFPNLRIIVGHAAYSMEYAIEVGMVLKTYKNVYYETSCSVSYGIYNLIKAVGYKKILYGSDAPTASTLPVEIDKIITLPRISKEIKQDILYNNVKDLLKL